jgi:PAS domain S-box-containing protein
MERSIEITSLILETLVNQKKSMSIVELMQQTGVHRNVLAKYIKVLEAQGKIEITRIGAKKFITLSQRVSASLLKSFITTPLVIFDKYLSIIDMNSQFLDLYTLENKENQEYSLDKTFFNDFLTEEIKKLLLYALEGTKSKQKLEISKNSKIYFFSLTTLPVALDNGRPGSALIINDITETEVLKKSFNQINAAYQKLLESQIQFIVRIDPNYSIISSNSIFIKHAGINEQSIIGSLFIPPYPKDNYDSVISQLSSISRDNPSISLDLRRINEKGDFSWEKWKIQGIYDKKSGNLTEYLAMGLDITELKRNEQEFQHFKDNFELIIQERTNELREVNSELNKEIYRREIIERELTLIKFAMDSAKDFIFLLNSEGEIQYMNLIAHKILAKSDNENLNIRSIINNSNSELINPFSFSLDEIIKFGLLTIKGTIKNSDEKDIPVEITISRIVERGEVIFCCVARDITDRNKIERDLFQYRKHLEEIIDERTKRLQKEIDSRNFFENACKKAEERFNLFADYSNELVIIYHKDTGKYIDINNRAKTFFDIDRKEIERSIPEHLSIIFLENKQNLLNFIEEKIIEIPQNEEHTYPNRILYDSGKDNKIIIRIRSITSYYQHYFRISITEG